MSKRNENKPGYKKPKVGWIPKDWDYDLVRSTGAVVTGTTPATLHPEYYGGEYPFVTPVDIGFSTWISRSVSTLTEEGLGKARCLSKGAVLFVCIGLTIGKVGIADVALATNQQINAIIPNNRNSGTYLYYALLAQSRRIASYAGCQAVPIINKNQLRNGVVTPSHLSEQRKIAEILSTWDEAIEQTHKLIDAKKRRKKALMQQLLAGKKRLPKFQKSWSLHKIGDLASILFSNVDKKTSSNEIPVRLCNYTDVYYNERLTRDMPLMEATVTNSEIQKYKLKKNDVIITKDSETAEDIAVPCYVADRVDDVVCGYHLAIIRPKPTKVHGPFLSQLIMTNYAHYQFVRIANGVTRFGLPLRSIKHIEIKIPPVAEQCCIAEDLSTADDEIKVLEKKLATLEKQKRGLMQKLLTGEIRVSV